MSARNMRSPGETPRRCVSEWARGTTPIIPSIFRRHGLPRLRTPDCSMSGTRRLSQTVNRRRTSARVLVLHWARGSSSTPAWTSAGDPASFRRPPSCTGAMRFRSGFVRSFLAQVALTCLTLMLPESLAAQTTLQIPLQFDFINPGAKSLALGGAFVGVADDATAAFSNPAGLTRLDGSEVSGELRGFRVSTPFLSAGRLSGSVTNLGTDTVAGAVFHDSTGSHLGVE